MDKRNVIIFSTVILTLGLIFCLASSTQAFEPDLNSDRIKKNTSPIIHISQTNRAVVEGQTVILDASKSFDPDGDAIKFNWKKIWPNDLNVHLSNDNTPVVSFVVPPVKTEQALLFKLSVVDSSGNADIDQFRVIISKKLKATKNEDQPVRGEPESIDSIKQKYHAGKSNTKSTVLSSKESETNPNAYTDSKQTQLPDQLSKSPSLADKSRLKVEAGKDMEVASGRAATLHGTLLSNFDSKQIKLSWTQNNGPRIELSSREVLNPVFIAPNVQRNERIQFELGASDENGFIDSDNVNVVIRPPPSMEPDNGRNSTFASKQLGITATASDTTKPIVIRTSPGGGTNNIQVNSVIKITFSEPMLASSVSTNTFTLRIADTTTKIKGAVSLSSDRKTATFTPSANLAASTRYVATIFTGTTDLAGNALSESKKWSFTTAATSTSGTTSRAGLYVPLFTYPTSSTWSTLINTKKSHPNLPMVVTINPSSGAGSSKDNNFVNGINQLKSAGVTVIGYVYTSYGQRSASVVQDEINKYKSWYGVNGIFFDEMSITSGKESYYSNLNSYVKSSGMSFTMGNPGADTRSTYIGTVDNMIIYESQGLPTIDSLKGWHLNYNKKNFSILPFGLSTLNTQFVKDAKSYVGYIYITNDGLPNPWDSLPSYFSSLVTALDQ